MKKRVGVLLGGLSSEKEISRRTGNAFVNALNKKGYPVEVIEVGADLPQVLGQKKIDVALIALHGKYGEDGTVQGILEYMRIPYSGSGVLGSALGMNKIISKQILAHYNIPTPQWEVIDLSKTSASKVHLKMQYPVVIKPSQEGSSVGMSIVKESSQLAAGLELAGKYDKLVLVEKYIDGKEITVPVVDGMKLQAIEIVPKTEWYDYTRKYTAGQTEYIIPARLSPDVMELCERYSRETFDALGCRTYARVDLRVSTENKPYVLEINTLPGCTETSLVPKAVAQAGIPFEDFVEKLVQTARLDYP